MLTILLIAAAIYYFHGFWTITGMVLLILFLRVFVALGTVFWKVCVLGMKK